MQNTVDKESDQVAEAFMRRINGGQKAMGDALLARIRGDHRTLQGYAIRVMVQVLRQIGSDPEWGCDLRNEGAVQWCNALSHLMDGGSVQPADVETLRNGFSVW